MNSGSEDGRALADTARAAQVYREVLEIDASNVNAMRGLVRACEGLQEWPELVKVLEAQLDVVNSERERVDILMQLANLHEEQFLKSELAAARLEQVLEIDPNHEDAYFALERNYRKLRQWHELVATYERHVSIAADRKTKVENYGFVAQIFAEEIVDVDRAIEAYRNLLDLDDSHVPALEAIAKLYEKQGDTAQSIEFTMRVADLTSDSKTRVEAYYRIGKIQDEKLGDRISARDSFDKVLELDPAHLPTLASLRQIALDDTDYYKAVEYMDLEQSHTQSARQRARLLVEIGKLRSATKRTQPSLLGKPLFKLTPRTKTRRCRSRASTSRPSVGRLPSRCSRCSFARAANATATSSTSCKASSARSASSWAKTTGR